jgi:hypothetical protein
MALKWRFCEKLTFFLESKYNVFRFEILHIYRLEHWLHQVFSIHCSQKVEIAKKKKCTKGPCAKRPFSHPNQLRHSAHSGRSRSMPKLALGRASSFFYQKGDLFCIWNTMASFFWKRQGDQIPTVWLPPLFCIVHVIERLVPFPSTSLIDRRFILPQYTIWSFILQFVTLSTVYQTLNASFFLLVL